MAKITSSRAKKDLGHWGRIAESAAAIPPPDAKISIEVVVQDLCRALLDLDQSLAEVEWVLFSEPKR